MDSSISGPLNNFFSIIRPLLSKRAIEVTHQLFGTFLLFGTPSILPSDNGSEFTEIIQELKTIWPILVMVHGKPLHPQSQGFVERANGDIKDMLTSWISDNVTNDWYVGIKFVQFLKNSTLHSGIKRGPYSAIFGCEAKVRLPSSSLPAEVIARLQSENDLVTAITGTQPPPTSTRRDLRFRRYGK
ncbi:KRAB-A domain-containing protein 2-like [Palaemon carinicauda]|uniref:KRAB-A domain-containing protein 2-like n=1 Tax=Palaemon carinicauda TaxID=392227 RepID=UPI0035B61133